MKALGLTRRVLVTLLIGAAGAVLARWTNLPGGALVGALILVGTVRMLNGPVDEPPKWMRSAGRMVLGLTIGATVTSETIQSVARALVPVTVMVFVMMGVGLLAAWALQRFAHMELPTALCGSAPGALGSMVVLADGLGGSGPVVASMHVVRLVSVLLFMPAFARTGLPGSADAALPLTTSAGAEDATWRLVLLVVVGILGALLALKLKLPTGEMLGAMALAAIVNPTWLHLAALPPSWRLFAQLVIGAGVGATVTRETLRHFRPFALAGGLTTAFLIVCGLAVGWGLAQVSPLDLTTCIVGCAPGGADTMILLAGELGGDPKLVTAMHLSRLIILMLLLPIIIRLATRSRTAPTKPLADPSAQANESA